jgi:uncharacterized protein with FMN-binding domain
MKERETTLYWTLLGVAALCTLAAAVTLLPSPGASKPNVLGYRSVCSFAPAGTALCCLLAAVTCTLRSRLVSRSASSARYRPLFAPIGAAVVFLAAAGVFGGMWAGAQARFGRVIAATPAAAADGMRDGAREATVARGEVSATVRVTVADGALTGVTLVSGRNVDAALVETIWGRIRASGSVAVDAVSGATASSRVVLAAISAAASGP